MIAPANSGQGRTHEAYAESAKPSAPPPDSELPPAPHPLEPLLKQAAMVREFALHYIQAQKDAAKATVRGLVIKAVIGAIAAIVGGTILITSAVMITDGLAEAISLAAGDRQWVGKLAVGGGVLLILALATWIYISRQKRAERERIIRKYESLHNAQRAKFGTDITQRAAL